MRKGFVLFVALGIFVLWVALPLTGMAQEGVQLTWEKAEIPAPIKGEAIWREEVPVPSEEMLRQREDCTERTHLYPRELTESLRGTVPQTSPMENEPSFIWDSSIEAAGDFNFRIIHELTPAEAGPSRSNIMEPSVAVKGGNQLLMTGNWFAAKSTNQGNNWTYIDPDADWPLYPAPTGYFYCCDQEVVFDPVEQLWFWSILYLSQTNTGGFVRIAVTKHINNVTWWAYDFDRETDGATDTTLPDFPHLALSRNYLYLTYNNFTNNAYTATYLLRLPIMPMVKAAGFGYSYYFSSDIFTLKVASDWRHPGTMYAVTNWLPSFPAIRVYEWKEDDSVFTYHDITGLNTWTWNVIYNCADPGGHNPCGRLDDRVLGVVASLNGLFPDTSKNQLWVSWTAAQDGTYSFPYTYIVKVSLADWSVIDYAYIYNSSFAFAYAAMAANARGDIGITIDLLGGPSYYNVFCALPIDEYQGYTPGFLVYPVAYGDAGPTNNSWGDYNSVSHWYRDMYQWVGSGHVRYSDARASTPYYIRFCRERDF